MKAYAINSGALGKRQSRPFHKKTALERQLKDDFVKSFISLKKRKSCRKGE